MSASPSSAPAVDRFWPKRRASVGKVRQHLREVLDDWEIAGITETAELVASELVTNALRHARVRDRLIIVRFQPTPEGGLCIEVHDEDERVPVQREVRVGDESGYGLGIVDALTDGRWGVGGRSPREGTGAVGKYVWAIIGPGGGDGRHA